MNAHLVEAALRLEDPDPVALEPLVVEGEVVSAEPFVRDLKGGRAVGGGRGAGERREQRERRGGSGGVLPQRLLKSRWQKPEVKVIWL